LITFLSVGELDAAVERTLQTDKNERETETGGLSSQLTATVRDLPQYLHPTHAFYTFHNLATAKRCFHMRYTLRVSMRGEWQRVSASHSWFQRVLSLATQRNALRSACGNND